jgi:hypothetical protein
VQRQGDRLHVLLEAYPLPAPQAAIEFVQDSIKDLNVQQITSIAIYGRLRGKKVPAWRQTVYLKPEHLSHQSAQPFATQAVHANFTSVDQAPADFLDPFPVDPTTPLMEPSETPDILKRPEAIILIIFASLLIFWDAYTSLLEEDDVLPTATLSTSQLARRLQTTRSTIRQRKRLADFGEWTQSLDPDGIAWAYRKGVYIPRALEALSQDP